MSRFFSWVFLVGFGIGAFVGVGMALLAVALSTEREVEDRTVMVGQTATPEATATAEAASTATAVPGPRTTRAQQVRIGPGSGYAVIGTIASGTEVNVLGRDDGGDWVAINFPPGSSARGWVEASSVTGLSVSDLRLLGIVAPTPLAMGFGPPENEAEATPTPFETAEDEATETPFEAQPDLTSTPVATPTPFGGGAIGGIGGGGPGELPPTPGPPGSPPPTPTATATPRSLNVGPTDLVLAGMSVLANGEVSVTVRNAGPGDMPAGVLNVSVSAAGYGNQTLTFPGELRAGESVTLNTSVLGLRGESVVTARVDPAGAVSDINPGNNTLTETLRP